MLSLQEQSVAFEYETIVVDNESDDDSVEVAKSFGCKVISIPRNNFTYGYSLNKGIEICNGKWILILSAHIILINEFFLQNIPAYFNHERVAALRFTEISNQQNVKAGLEEGAQVLQWKNEDHFIKDHWNHLPANHCAAIAKKAWEQNPYDAQLFASEDKAWALEILKQDWEIIYQIPLFYVYSKPFSREIKIKRAVIEELAKEKITGIPSPYRNASLSLKRSLLTPFRKIKSDRDVHKEISRQMKKFKLP